LELEVCNLCVSRYGSERSPGRLDDRSARRAAPRRVRQHAECCAQNAFGVRVVHLGVGAHLLERSACFSLAKAESAQRAKRLRMSFSNARIHDGPVPSAVGMTKHETSRHAALDEELPAVHGTVVRSTEHDECVSVVIAALGAKPKVVEVHEHRVGTAWNDAPAAIPPHHLASHRRRHVLSRS
jgi:hypothetical protein